MAGQLTEHELLGAARRTGIKMHHSSHEAQSCSNAKLATCAERET